MKRTLTVALAVVFASLLIGVHSPPANACLLPCSTGEVTGTVLGGGMPDILLGLAIGLMLAIIASFVAYRAGVRNGGQRLDPDREP